MAEGLTREQQYMLIKICENINRSFESFSELNEDLNLNDLWFRPQLKFLRDRIPSFADKKDRKGNFDRFLSKVLDIKEREEKDYRSKYGEFKALDLSGYFEKIGLGEFVPPPEPEKGKEAGGGAEQIKTFAKNAFITGTPVPPFVMKVGDTLKDFSGFKFEHKKDMGTVALSKGGRKILIDSSFYNSIIENSKIVANAPAVTPEVIARYGKAAELDREKMRPNTASNFWHNYRVMCRQNASNLSDAMKIAGEIVSKMPPYERMHLKREIKEYNRLTGSKDAYNGRLVDFYNENVKDLPVTRSIFSKESPQLVSGNYYDVIQKTGELVDKNSPVKIGESAKMAFDYTDIATGKTKKLEPREYIIVASSKDKNKVVLVDKDNLSKYALPRDEFLEQRRKQEKIINKEHRKEQKKEMRSSLAYSY